MKLYLMRHGQAAEKDQDTERGLTAAGRIDIERLASQLAEQGITIAQVFHSGKARALQTAEIMVRHLAPEVQLTPHTQLKPNDDPEQILSEIMEWEQDTLITSHLPFISNLLARLTGVRISEDIASFEPPGTVVCLSKTEDGAWQIEWRASP